MRLFDDSDEDAALPSLTEIELALLAVRQGTMNGEPARAYALIQALRAQADKYERDLIRMLRWNDKNEPIRKWAEVAELVDAGLNSKQAAWARWGLIAPSSRGKPARDSKRRGRPPGRSTSQ